MTDILKPIGLENQILDALGNANYNDDRLLRDKTAYIKANIDKIIKINGDRVYNVVIDDDFFTTKDLFPVLRYNLKNRDDNVVKYYYPVKYANIELK